MSRLAGLEGPVVACRAAWRRALAIGSLIVINGLAFWGVLVAAHHLSAH